MADPGLALHKAIYTALQSISVPTYDSVPRNASYPYVTLDTTATDNADLLSERVDFTFVYLAIWSEQRGQEQVLSIMGEINDLLHEQPLTLDNGTVVSVRVERKSTQRDADNETFMGSMTLRVIVKH